MLLCLGASGIRANSPEDIIEIKKIVNLPIIGLYKKIYTDSDVYITPTMSEVDAIVDAGADIIALDATDRLRPGNTTLENFFRQVRSKYPELVFMADTSCYEEGAFAEKIGFDIVGTTMSGYTHYTKGNTLPDIDLMIKYVKNLSVPIIAEGGIWAPDELKQAINTGVWAAVVGTAITRPLEITKRFANQLNNYLK